MARNIGIEYKRLDVFQVNPDDLDFVAVELRGRWRPMEPETIQRMALSLVEHGQLQPVIIRVVPGARPLLVGGHTRTLAARLLRQGFEVDGVKYHQPDFLLKATYTDAKDELAGFLATIEENNVTERPSDLDHAHNQDILRQRFHLTDVEIGRRWGMSNVKVCNLKKLLTCSEEVKLAVHRRELGLMAALDTLDLPPDRLPVVLEEARKDSGRINGSVIRAAIREVAEAAMEQQEEAVTVEVVASGPAEVDASEAVTVEVVASPKPATVSKEAPKTKPRTMKELKELFAEIAAQEKYDSLGAALLAFAEGKKTSKAVLNALVKVTG